MDNELGYIMLKANEHVCLKEYLQMPNDDFDDWYKTQFTFKKRCQIILNLFRCLREIHMAGLVFTDLSPNNIMVHKTQNQIVFIDTDNTRRRTDMYLGVLGTPGYMAPEIYRKPNIKLAKENGINPELLSNCGRITPESDIFSAAVIAFQLLTLQHPFVGDEIEEGTADEETAALEIKTDYIFKEGTANTSTYGLTRYFDDITTLEIRSLFERTFVAGKDNPSLRPTDEEFVEAFQNVIDLIVECNDCGFSRLYMPGIVNKCINCDKPFGKKVYMKVYNYFKNIRRDQVINAIGDFPEYDVDVVNLLDENGEEPSHSIEICMIVLEPGEINAKYLYMRHFESTTERSAKYARIVLSDNQQSVRIEIMNNAFQNPVLVEKAHRSSLIPLNQGKEFPLDNYGIIFDSKKHGQGQIQIFAKFGRG